MSINPKMWDDEHLNSLSVEAQLIWCYLLSCGKEGVPGLIRGGPGAIAEAKRMPLEVAMRCMDELLRVAFIEYDPQKLLIRIPGRPEYKKPGNANVLRGWYRRWQELPESPLKYSHLDALKAAGESRKWFAAAWDETFGLVKVPEHSRQVPLFMIEPSTQLQLLSGNANESSALNGSQTNGGLFPPLNVTETETETVTETVTETDRPRVADPIERHMVATELWALQEELRTQLAPGVQARESTRHHLGPIMDALENYTPEELRNSLAVNAAQARNNPDKLQYFNGHSNWHPESLKRTVGQVVPVVTGRQSMRGRTKFRSGNVLAMKGGEK